MSGAQTQESDDLVDTLEERMRREEFDDKFITAVMTTIDALLNIRLVDGASDKNAVQLIMCINVLLGLAVGKERLGDALRFVKYGLDQVSIMVGITPVEWLNG